MKKIVAIILVIVVSTVKADEGMWMPQLIKAMRYGDMKKNGFKLTAEQIYSINKASMKDAVIIFGGGCTGELISEKGLLLTNHHCGFSTIASLSSVEKDYLKNGFWAMSQNEEIPCPNLSVTFIKRIEDVTKKALQNTSKSNTDIKNDSIIQVNIASIAKDIKEKEGLSSIIRPFYYGNEYYLFVTEVFDDVRLVGTPPENIGKFGGETDNWVWPRHNPDFSMFRIYANKDNKPAPYDPSNKPYKPAHYFPISLKGYQKGDFTMVYGFPGRTQEYLPSIAVEQIVKEINPRRTALREKRLNIYEKDMALNDTIRLMYASRYAGIANAYKKWTGEMIGLQKYNAIEKKNSFEKSFMDLFKNNPEKLKENKTLFTEIENAYNDYSEKNRIIDYYYECLMGIDIFRYINSFSSLFAEYKLKSEGKENKLEEKLNAFSKSIPFKNYRKETDIKLCEVMLAAYFDEVEETKRVPYLNQLYKAHNGNIKSLTKDLYDKSVFVDEEKMREVLKNFENKAVMYQDDPFYKLYAEISKHYAALMPSYNAIRLKIEDLQKVYMAALKDNVKTKQFYPDANGTLRVAYGKVNNYTPKDGVEYNFYTTIDGMVEKHATGNPDYEVQDRLIELYNKKDFGQYLDKDGTLHVSFIASNHTTGGNSGSPVLNANGELIGTNYDRNWEGTMSDVMYDPNMCRNISLDVRFTLWVIDKYAGAGYLLNEMKLIK